MTIPMAAFCLFTTVNFRALTSFLFSVQLLLTPNPESLAGGRQTMDLPSKFYYAKTWRALSLNKFGATGASYWSDKAVDTAKISRESKRCRDCSN